MDLSNFKFIFIPKTGTTTLITQLEKVDPTIFSFNAPHRTATQYKAIDPNYDNKFSFSIIRNPFQRMISLWQHDIHSALGTKNLDYKKFYDFNTWVEEQASHVEWLRYSWSMPQWYWVSDSTNIIVSKLYRFENYKESLIDLSSKLNVKFDLDLVMNVSMKKHHYNDVASPATKKIMIEMYKIDCDKFNYDW